MCELLGMSANVPTDLCFSFTGLLHRGGGTGPHRDGWGVVFYEGKGIRAFRDSAPSVESEIAKLVSQFPMKSCIAISHIREANVGVVSLENTHPFVRELWGQNWTFAHNGQLANVDDLPLGEFTPVGTTDSERAFCWLLAKIKYRFGDPDTIAEDRVNYWRQLKRWCDHLKDMGVTNLLFSEGRYLYAYCSTKLTWITRRAPFGEAQLSDAEMTVDFGEHTTCNDVVTVIATKPLTNNESWTQMEPGEFIVFDQGEVAFSLS
ncbi:class II glutamine amidotransferase [Gilvimarinus sp. SDUM040013]|uniref:Class II glutamine amidotransferase n=1 Tax=Gilvimarinus gilvus TaxID=3058038 RepID=A0ABU4RYU2_9GAMM|nr:class II glutamine amidotransferase [Gilvimarinus sp. SDUM040013]MDO3386952.1 class II glutamine amidotransferase [Gilvimarinus sp. SDUM040013]MDX6848154.1 class II glutamine amidotransferase [Gilvimarinus sp. SDUM040013]